MPFNTKFTPSNYQDRDQYNESVLNESYTTVKSLRESYSNLYQEFTNLRNIWNKIPKASKAEEEQIEISAHYSGYMLKEEADIIAFRKGSINSKVIVLETRFMTQDIPCLAPSSL